MSLAVHAGLAYLSARFAAPVPPAVLRQLVATPASCLERWDARAQVAPPTFAWQLARYGTRYLRMSRGRDPLQRAVGVPVFAQEMLGLSSVSQVPGRLLRGRRSAPAVRATRG